MHLQARGGEFYAWEGKEWSGEEGREMPVVQEKSFAARPLRISCLQIFLSWPTGISWSRSGRGSGRSSRRWTLSESRIDSRAASQTDGRISPHEVARFSFRGNRLRGREDSSRSRRRVYRRGRGETRPPPHHNHLLFFVIPNVIAKLMCQRRPER